MFDFVISEEQISLKNFKNSTKIQLTGQAYV